jgi:CRP-like cAMP-binding protein
MLLCSRPSVEGGNGDAGQVGRGNASGKQALASSAERSSDATRRESEICRRLTSDYEAVQYVFVQFLTEHLSDCARAFGGDLAQVLVLATIGQSMLHARTRVGPPVHGAETNASRIADVTGLPRETVRRKLARLADRGWMRQAERGTWELSVEDDVARARSDLEDLDARGLRRLARLHADLEGLLWT